MNFFLSPLSFFYSFFMSGRNWLYDNGYLKVHRFSVPIVSIGNLTWGGTGKTPILCELLRWSLEQGLKPAVVSRGYKGRVRGVERVAFDGDPTHFGDEPVMVANRFSNVPIYVGADRVAAVKTILANEKIQIIFADDAFQHRRLGRSLDVVILDCTEKTENYKVAPLGRARENKKALCRAQFVILNKVNLSPPQNKQAALDFIGQICSDVGTPIIESEYYLKRLVKMDGTEEATSPRYQSVLLVSGIGNPSAFAALVSKNHDVRGHLIYRDHHNYSDLDIEKIINEAQRLKVEKIFITEKDAIKLRRFKEKLTLVCVAELAPKLSLRVKGLYEKILDQLR